jgi:hypothetical protein
MIGPAVFAAAVHLLEGKKNEKNLWRIQMFHCRKHVSVAKVYSTMGPQIFHQAFHITLDSFWCLYSILLPHICTAARRMTRRDYQDKGGREGGNYVLPPIPNGLISPSIHLGAALH